MTNGYLSTPTTNDISLPTRPFTHAPADAKTNHFVRLLKLWETGGVYLDFTTLLTKPFPAGQRFWSFGHACAADRDASNADWGYAGSQEHYVLAAPKPKDPVLGCALKKFDDAKDGLHACLAKAAAADADGGAACLRNALDECAKATKGGVPTLVRGVGGWVGWLEWDGVERA